MRVISTSILKNYNGSSISRFIPKLSSISFSSSLQTLIKACKIFIDAELQDLILILMKNQYKRRSLWEMQIQGESSHRIKISLQMQWKKYKLIFSKIWNTLQILIKGSSYSKVNKERYQKARWVNRYLELWVMVVFSLAMIKESMVKMTKSKN